MALCLCARLILGAFVMAPVCCLIVTAAVEHVDDFHGFSDSIDDYGAALKGHRTQPRLKVVTRSAAVRYIANPAARPRILPIKPEATAWLWLASAMER